MEGDILKWLETMGVDPVQLLFLGWLVRQLRAHRRDTLKRLKRLEFAAGIETTNPGVKLADIRRNSRE